MKINNRFSTENVLEKSKEFDFMLYAEGSSLDEKIQILSCMQEEEFHPNKDSQKQYLSGLSPTAILHFVSGIAHSFPVYPAQNEDRICRMGQSACNEPVFYSYRKEHIS